jgi:hypothetical protein
MVVAGDVAVGHRFCARERVDWYDTCVGDLTAV